MLQITCNTCEEVVTVNMHISSPAISAQRDGFHDRRIYIAHAKVVLSAPNAVLKLKSILSRRFVCRMLLIWL